MEGEVVATRVLDGNSKKVSFAPKPPSFELSHTLAGENDGNNANPTGC